MRKDAISERQEEQLGRLQYNFIILLQPQLVFTVISNLKKGNGSWRNVDNK